MLVDFVVLTLFYRALDNNSAENSASSITFGTVFADTFCKQPHSNIQTKVMKKGLITSILALTFSGLQAQPLPASPKLVVTLTIDQLRTDYMEAFSSLYGEKGFKRLLREGKVFRQAEFPFCGTDRASAIAAIYTGTTPSMKRHHCRAVAGCRYTTPHRLCRRPQLHGNYTDESTSPSLLLTSTIADELKIATRNKGLVYAIAPFRDAAILGCRTRGERCLLA